MCGKKHLVRPDVVRSGVRVRGEDSGLVTGDDSASGRSVCGVDDVVDDRGRGRRRAGSSVGASASDGVAAGEGRKETKDHLVDLRRLTALVGVVVQVENRTVVDDTGVGSALANRLLQDVAVPAV